MLSTETAFLALGSLYSNACNVRVTVLWALYECTSFSNYTAWKWQLEKKNHYLAPELAAYTLTRSFSYASHQCGRDSLTPNCHIYTVTGLYECMHCECHRTLGSLWMHAMWVSQNFGLFMHACTVSVTDLWALYACMQCECYRPLGSLWMHAMWVLQTFLSWLSLPVTVNGSWNGIKLRISM